MTQNKIRNSFKYIKSNQILKKWSGMYPKWLAGSKIFNFSVSTQLSIETTKEKPKAENKASGRVDMTAEIFGEYLS